MSKNWTDQEIEELVQVLETKGIATRDDNPNLNSRNLSRNIQSVFESKGYTDYTYIEVALEDYSDYSGAVYNCNLLSDQEAREYMKKHILQGF